MLATKGEPLLLEIKDLIHSIQNNTTPLMTGQYALDALDVAIKANKKLKKKKLSVIIPAYNEASILKKNLDKIEHYLNGLDEIEDYEILICDNGSTDKTLDIARRNECLNIHALHDSERGIGVGLKLGIAKAKYDLCVFQPADIPFKLDIIERMLKETDKYDIVVGSKWHKDSKNVKSSMFRRILSWGYNTLIRWSTDIKLTDTQGVVMFKKSGLSKKVSANDSFIQTEIIHYGMKANKKVTEVPVEMYTQSKRRVTRLNIFSETFKMLDHIWEIMD